jgi:hypothetical protein
MAAPVAENRHARLAVVSDAVARGEPVTRILHGRESGFVLLDAEMQDENPDDHEVEEFTVVCEACLVEKRPEIGRGMDLAKRAGSSRFHAGIWTEEMP